MSKKRVKHYNSIEAINMLKQGYKMCHDGHNHRGGYYFDLCYAQGYEDSQISPKLVEHIGDGSICKANVELFDCGLFWEQPYGKELCKKRKWIVAVPEDFDLKEFPLTLRERVEARIERPKDRTFVARVIRKIFVREEK